MSSQHPYRGVSKRLAVLCDIGRTWVALSEVPPATPDDPLPGGYRRILEARVVRDTVSRPDIMAKTVKQTDEFRKNFASYDLGAAEGYLLSLVGQGLSVRKVLLISTLGRFPTLFNLARLEQKGVIVFSSEPEADTTLSRRRH